MRDAGRKDPHLYRRWYAAHLTKCQPAGLPPVLAGVPSPPPHHLTPGSSVKMFDSRPTPHAPCFCGILTIHPQHGKPDSHCFGVTAWPCKLYLKSMDPNRRPNRGPESRLETQRWIGRSHLDGLVQDVQVEVFGDEPCTNALDLVPAGSAAGNHRTLLGLDCNHLQRQGQPFPVTGMGRQRQFEASHPI